MKKFIKLALAGITLLAFSALTSCHLYDIYPQPILEGAPNVSYSK